MNALKNNNSTIDSNNEIVVELFNWIEYYQYSSKSNSKNSSLLYTNSSSNYRKSYIAQRARKYRKLKKE